MQLLLTLLDPDADAPGGRSCDVAVEAPAGTPLAAVHAELVAALGTGRTSAATSWRCDGRPAGRDDPLGEGALVAGAVLVAQGAPMTEAPPEHGSVERAPVAGGLVLAVRSGPDAGHHLALRAGRLVIGRGRGSDLVVDDPGVSRHHLAVDVTAEAVRVEDLGSVNGSLLVPAAGPPAAVVGRPLLGAGDRVQIGSSELELRVAAGERVLPAERGLVAVNRAPRVAAGGAGGTFRLPAAPVAPTPPRISWVAVVVPLALSVVMAVLWSPIALLFGLSAPVLLLSTTWGERRAQRRSHRAAVLDHAAACEGVRARAATAAAAVLADLEALAPDPAAVAEVVRARLPRLWSRRPGGPDALVVRLGIGAVPSEVVVEDADGAVHDAGPTPPVGAPVGAPVALSLARAGVLGLAGEREAVAGLARAALLQLAALHSPRDLQLVVLVPEGGSAAVQDWRWTRWLPHGPLLGDGPQAVGPPVHGVGELLELVRTRRQQLATTGGARSAPARSVVVLLVDAGALRTRPGVVELLAHGPRVGVHALCLEEGTSRLPLECAAVAELSARDGRLEVAADAAAWAGSTGAPPPSAGTTGRRSAVPDRVSSAAAERSARDLAPLRDATPPDRRSVLPDQVRLLDLLTVDATDPAALAAGWARRPRSVVVALGVTTSGPWVVDLDRDGPHVLVAGTTGAGKSELLQTLVIGLAVANLPEELSLVLVDYKGGAAFAGLVDLPHTAGVVTDLDASGTERALLSLQAEVHRRERVLRRAGCRDHGDHVRRRSRGEDLPPLPRLVIVVDEFRVLAEELPDFLAGLVRLAAVGRSLGLHLVLATQRPAGVVSSDVRANVNLRIALRVRDEPDSTDVVESKDAAHLDPSSPGRALARTGGGPLVEVQTARVGGTAPRRESRVLRVRVLDDAGRVRPAAPADGLEGVQDAAGSEAEAELDVDLVVDALRRAAHGSPRAARPWLPPLPDRVDVDALLDAGAPGADPLDDDASGPPAGGPRGLLGAGAGLVLGLQDRPRSQGQPPLVWAADGPLLVAGGPRSGRTGALRAVVAAAARRSPAHLHVHVVGAPGGELDDLAGLPHVGAVVDRQDVDRLLRLLRTVVRAIRERRAGGTAETGPEAPQEGPGSASSQAPPLCLMLVDGADRVLADAAADPGPDGAEVTALLHEVVADGPPVGVLAVLTGDRTLLTHKLGSAVARRLVLAMADPTDHVLAGIPPRAVPARMPPGRTLVVGFADDPDDGSPRIGLAQLARAEPVTPSHGTFPDAPGRVSTSGPGRVPVGVWKGSVPASALPPATPATPTRWSLDDAAPTAGAAAAGQLLVGVGGHDVSALHLDLSAAPAALVAGPAGSGRSSLLATLGEVAVRDGVDVLVVARGRSPLTTWARSRGARVLDPDDTAVLTGALQGPADDADTAAAVGPPGLVLVDDVEELAGTAAEEVLCRHLVALVAHRSADHQGSPPDGGGVGALVVAGTGADLVGQFRGLVPQVRRWRTGVLLHPIGLAEGDLLGTRCPRTPAGVPGRATAVLAGRACPVQLGLPGTAAPAPPPTTPASRTPPARTPPRLGPRRPGRPAAAAGGSSWLPRGASPGAQQEAAGRHP